MHVAGPIQRFAVVAAVLSLALAVARPALADDNLTVIGASSPTGFYEILDHVALLAGFFKEEHLNVDKEYVNQGSSSSCAQLVATGKADVCTLGTEPVFQGYERGLHVVMFQSRGAHYQWVLAVPADSPIKSLADFKGATLGEMSAGSPAEVNAQATLGGAGLKRTDYAYLPIGSGAAAVAAFTSKKVDGAAFPYAELATYEVKAGLKFRYFWNPLVGDIGDIAYVATPAVIASKADILRRYTRANVKAAILIRVNPQLAARYFLEGAGIKVTDQSLADETRLLELTQNLLPAPDPMSNKIGELPPVSMQVYSKFLFEAGLTSQLVPASAIVTTQFTHYSNDFDHKAFIAQAKAMR
jgi:NitT/TauT family transport system substrate-binding protein